MTQIALQIETETLPNGTSFDMVLVEKGDFWMGESDGKHLVKMAKDFYIGKYPVTQAVWEAVMGADNNASFFKGKNRPVESVSWDQITQEFLPALNRLTGREYFLPSEAQWEFAARGGQYSKGFTYAGSNTLKEVGWYNLNSHRETKLVGLKAPNELGLYDMSGNVDEWCQDVWHDSYKGAPADGSAWMEGGNQAGHVVRGGSWNGNANFCRSAIRYWNLTDYRLNYIGFRLACPAGKLSFRARY